MTTDKRPGPPSDGLPDWLREDVPSANSIDVPVWLDTPEDDDELDIAVHAQPPAVSVPRVSPAWVTRDAAASTATPQASTSPARSRSGLFVGLALSLLLAIAVLIVVALVIW